MVENGFDEIDFASLTDISHIFFSDLFKDNDDFLRSSSSSPLSDIEHPLSSDVSSWIRGIEQDLLNDDDDVDFAANVQPDEDFFADLDLPFNQQVPDKVSDDGEKMNASEEDEFSDFLTDDHQSADEVRVSLPENSTLDSQISFEEKEDENVLSADKEGNEKKRANTDADSEERDNEDDDPITKKRKRQMRNRDAAVRSRERKKVYVRDLEVKSKYLERECIRLQRLLQCCAAENHALHLQLQKEKVYGASRTKQESAVLLLESLLLGSLLWFLGFLGLFTPLELDRLQVPAVLVNVGSNNQKVVDLVALGRAKSKSIGLGTLRLFFKSKRCKASRSKIKIATCYGTVVA